MATLPPRRSGGDFDRPDDRPARKSNNALWIVLAVAAACLVALCMIGGVLAALLLPAIQQARDAARQAQAKNNLKQIGLAAHNFHDMYNQLPPPPADGSGNPDVTSTISFHTAVLPFVDQQPLYGMIDKSIPWDDANNRVAYSTPVRVFLSPQVEETTNANGYAVTHFVPSSQIIRDGKGIPFREVTDGTSNTVMFGQIDAAYPAWGDPANPRDPANGFTGGPNAFGGPRGALVLMMDGSVRTVSPTIAPGVAKAIATPDGGEPVGNF